MVDIIVQMEPMRRSPTPVDTRKVYKLEAHNSLTLEDVTEEDLSSCTNSPDNTKHWLTPPPRTKTRLLSRSKSVSDITGEDKLGFDLEPPRRNSSSEFSQQYIVLSPVTPMGKQLEVPSPNQLHSYKSGGSICSIGLTETPVTPVTASHLSPITNLQYPGHQNWNHMKPVPAQEDRFSILLQTTAERVLSRLKTRQQDLGKTLQTSRKMRKHPQGVHPHVPRKLQPILRDGKTPQLGDVTHVEEKPENVSP